MRERMFRCGIALFGNESIYVSSSGNAVTYDVIRILTVGGPGAFKLTSPLFPFHSPKVFSAYILVFILIYRKQIDRFLNYYDQYE